MKSYKNKGSGIFYKTFIVYICIQQQQNKGENAAGVEVLAQKTCLFFFFFTFSIMDEC